MNRRQLSASDFVPANGRYVGGSGTAASDGRHGEAALRSSESAMTLTANIADIDGLRQTITGGSPYANS